jgi:hypothetical protein
MMFSRCSSAILGSIAARTGVDTVVEDSDVTIATDDDGDGDGDIGDLLSLSAPAANTIEGNVNTAAAAPAAAAIRRAGVLFIIAPI